MKPDWQLFNVLNGKASSNHTHKLDDENLTYEEEEETKGELSTITKTKTLSNILTGHMLHQIFLLVIIVVL